MLHNWYGPVRVSISRTTFVTLRSGSTFSAFWQSNCCMLITPPPEESPLHSTDSQNSDKLKYDEQHYDKTIGVLSKPKAFV